MIAKVTKRNSIKVRLYIQEILLLWFRIILQGTHQIPMYLQSYFQNSAYLELQVLQWYLVEI